MWRVRGRRPNGDAAYLTVTATDDEVLVHAPTGDPIALSPDRAQRLREVVAWAMERVLRGRRW